MTEAEGRTPHGTGRGKRGDRPNELPIRTPWQRRLLYGANVALLLAAVAVIVVLINWIAADKVRQWGGWARLDVTATRKYSLSDQSRKLMRGLEQPVRITTVFAEGVGLSASTVRRMRYFRDLLDEYERLGGGRIEVDHVDPTTDVGAFDRLASRVREHYEDELKPIRSALEAARRTLTETDGQLQRINAYISQNLGKITGEAPALANWMRRAGLPISERAVADLGFEELAGEVDALEEEVLPDYRSARQSLLRALRRLDEAGYQAYVDALDRVEQGDGEAGPTSEAVEEFVAGLRTLVENARSDLQTAIDKLEAAETADYAGTRRSLQQSNSVLVIADGGLSTIELEEVYTASATGDDDSGAVEQRFRGEEAVTGAIVSLTLDVKPMVVFVNPLSTPAIGPRGIFSHVASRLESMNFEVREWRTGAVRGPRGPQPPTPKPEPAEGQPVAWIYVAPPPVPQEMLGQGVAAARRDLADALDGGANALVFVPYWPFGGGAMGGERGPLYVEPLASLGIAVDADARIHVQRTGPEGQMMAVPQVELTDWPDTHPITRAVAGQPGVLVSAVPMSVDDASSAEVWPLIRTPRHAWAESGLSDNPSPDADEASGPLTVGLAASRPDQRVVAIGDALFAIDQVTQAGPREMFTGRLVRAQYPANAELVVSSIYWLAGLDNLIAASARTQDVRRFERISPSAGQLVQWMVMVGLPLLCLVVGGVTWLVRRT